MVTDPAAMQKSGKQPGDSRDWQLTDEIRNHIHAAIVALPPMTDEQVDAIADVIITARERRRRTRQPREPTAKPERE